MTPEEIIRSFLNLSSDAQRARLDAMTRDQRVEMLQLMEEYTRRKAKDSLSIFAGRRGFVPALHHKLMIEHLEALERYEIKNLMMCLPPGAAKSSYSSILFPAWFMGRHPDAMLLLTSNTMELAETFGRRIRNIVGSTDYRSEFGFGLSSDSTAAARWSNDKGGELLGAGVGGSIVGRRCDCLVANTQIETYNGFVRIDQVKAGDYVLSADADSRTCYRRVVAVAQREADEYLRIHTAAGHMVEATGNHKIFANGAYIPADSIAVGDILLSVRGAGISRSGGSGEGAAKEPKVFPGVQPRVRCKSPQPAHEQGANRISLRVLWEKVSAYALRVRQEIARQPGLQADMQPVLRYPAEQCQSRDAVSTDMQQLRQRDVRRAPWCEGLFCGVSKGDSEARRRTAQKGFTYKVVFGLRHAISPKNFFAYAKVLLHTLQERSARIADGRGRQPYIPAWLGAQPVFAGAATPVSRRAQTGVGAGSSQLRNLRGAHALERTPYRHEPAEQHTPESSDYVPRLSCGFTCSGAPKALQDTVSVVERVRSRESVYDLQIEGTECFFANGVLVHNCLIMDDVVRSREDVSSETMRERVWQWYTADVLTRMKPRARQVFCNTRWHEDDLAGRILERDSSDWTILKLEMENTREDDPLGRAVGERLWPEWFTEEMVARAKQDPASWSALYQQNPSPEGGGEFKKAWVEFYDTPPNRKNTTNLIIVDPANEKSRKSDYTAMWVIGMGGDGNAYVLDILRDKLNLAERTETLFKLHRKYKPVEVRYEQYGMQSDVSHIKLEMDRLSYRFRIREVRGMVKKEDRIRRLIPWFRDGKMVFPREFIYTDLAGRSNDLVRIFVEEELAPFPVAKHDDMMDALSRLAEPGLVLPKHVPEEERKLMFGDDSFAFQPIDDVMGY